MGQGFPSRSKSGQKRVQVRSGGRGSAGVGARRVGPAGRGTVAPRKVSIFVLNLDALTKDSFHVCAFVSVTREFAAKSASYVHLIQNRWCSEFLTYVGMCIEFVIQVSKQKTAHVFFLWEWYVISFPHEKLTKPF